MNQLIKLLSDKRLLFFPPVLVGAGIVAWMISGKKELSRIPLAEKQYSLTVQRIEKKTITPSVSAFGTANPARVWTAVAEVGGVVENSYISLDSGAHVKKGELLVRIDPSDYQLRWRQQEADWQSLVAKVKELIANQKADLRSLEIENRIYQVNRRDYLRMKGLVKTNTVSQSELETAEGNYLRQAQSVQNLKNTLSLYPSRIEAAEASAKRAKTKLDELKRDIDRTEIKSPFSGLIANSTIELGQVVSKGQQLFEIQDDQRIEIKAEVSLSQLGYLLPALEAEDQFRASNLNTQAILNSLTSTVIARSGSIESRWIGRPVRLSESLNTTTRTIGIVIEVINNSENQKDLSTNIHRLRSGTFCEVILSGKPFEKVITVPNTSLTKNEICVVDSENRLRRRTVSTGRNVGQNVLIKSGLFDGDVIVVEPPVPVLDGMLISPTFLAASTKPEKPSSAPTNSSSSRGQTARIESGGSNQ